MRGKILLTTLAVLTLALSAAAQDLGTEQQRAAGKVLYDKFCSQCHGVDGDGEGYATPYVLPRPRDFRQGKYKIRTTPSGELPTTQDLKNIIRRGMPYSTMPAWPQFSDKQLTELAYYLKTFSPKFADPDFQPTTTIEIGRPPTITEESIANGRKVYEEIGCLRCHGELAQGDGSSAPTLKDDWGNYLKIADMTKRWTFRGGPRREDIYRAFSSGLNGTPMPSYYDTLTEEQRWDLVNYIYSLGEGDEAPYDDLAIARKVSGDLDIGDPELFDRSERALFPVVGQIQEPGREFFPSANAIEVRAVYNTEAIAIELKWHDMRAETTGVNGPDLEVPAFELDPFRQPATKAVSDDPFADAEADPFADAEVDPFADVESGGEDFWGEEGDAGEAGATGSGPDWEFSDAVAIQFPVEIPQGIKRPYFIFGDGSNPVDLWFFDLAKGAPEMFVGRGSVNLASQGAADLEATSAYDRGEWRVVFKRPLHSTGGIALDEGVFTPVAFSVWDGFNRERGNKRGLTQWWSLYLQPPAEAEKSTVGPMAKAAGAVLVFELLLIGWVRRKYPNGLETKG